jgi:hypothetical protein
MTWKKIAVLKQVSLFAGLDELTIEQLASISNVEPSRLGPSTEGEADASLFIVISGVIKIDKQNNAEQQQTLQQLATRVRRDLVRPRRRLSHRRRRSRRGCC